MEEIWTKYDEINVPHSEYEISEIIQNADGTKIILEIEKNKMEVKFGFVDANRYCDEGRRLFTYFECDGLQEYREHFFGNPLYMVENSKFKKWVIEESLGMKILNTMR